MGYKTWRSIEMTLDPKSIKQALKEIEECKKQLVAALSDLAKQLTEQGAQIAKMQIASMEAVDTGELEHSVRGQYNAKEHIGYIRAGEGLTYAFYVEYGTGPVGESNQHPEPEKVGWEYNVGETIGINEKHPEWGEGWWYPGDDGRAHWTAGQPARPFMYNTFIWLEEAAQALGRNIFT